MLQNAEQMQLKNKIGRVSEIALLSHRAGGYQDNRFKNKLERSGCKQENIKTPAVITSTMISLSYSDEVPYSFTLTLTNVCQPVRRNAISN